MRKIILITTLMIASTIGVLGAENTVLDRIDVTIDEPKAGEEGCGLEDIKQITQGANVDDLLWGEGETFGVDYTGSFEEDKTYRLSIRITLSNLGYEITPNTKVFINDQEASIVISKAGDIDDEAFINCSMLYDMTDPVVARKVPSLEMTLISKLTVGMTIKDAIDMFKSNIQYTAGDKSMIKNIWIATGDEITKESSSLLETDVIQEGVDYYYVIQEYKVQPTKLNGEFCKNGNSEAITFAFKAKTDGSATDITLVSITKSDGKIYNLQGVEVDENYKGLVVKDRSVMLKR